jgi:hypothetical protein|tara:strand:+ start:419 stop:547 length:129 start_codon:yes stop_codon:yes gene_type:complete
MILKLNEDPSSSQNDLSKGKNDCSVEETIVSSRFEPNEKKQV